MPRLRAATRGSSLARWQTNRVAELLAVAHPGIEVEPVIVETEGDRRQDAPLEQIGGRGVFVKEVQAAVLEGRADIAVHSAKDLPASIPVPGLVLAAVPERADPRDCLVGVALADLRPAAVVATGAVRRRAQLAWHRPDLTFTNLRGNIETRLTKVPPGGAIVMAVAALDRLDLTEHIAEVLEPDVMLPQVAQGALAVECREDDGDARDLLAAIEHGPSRLAVDTERAFLRAVGGGCDAPLGAHAVVGRGGGLSLEVMAATADGRVLVRRTVTGTDPDALGAEAARRLPPQLLGGDWGEGSS